MVAPPSVSIGDLEYAFYKAAVPAADNNMGVTLGQGIKTSSIQTANKNATIVNSASVGFAPLAGAVIAQVTAAVAGYYRVQFAAGYGAVSEVTTADNLVLKKNAALITVIPVLLQANYLSGIYEIFVNLAATDTINVNIGTVNSSANTTARGYVSITQVG